MKVFALLFNLLASTLPLYTTMDLSQLPEPYKSAHLMPFNSHGWYSNAASLERIVKDRGVKVIVEVGSWMGLSARHLASLLPEGGVLYAVDTWKGSPNEVHDPQVLATLYDQFLSNIIYAGLTHKIIPMRMESSEAAAIFSDCPDLVYIDATHTYEAATQDFRAWWPFVRGHGILCGDDWAWAEVERAVIDFAEKNQLLIRVEGNFWCLEETS